MSGSNPKRSSKSTSKKDKSRNSSKKRRSGWERIAVWSGIAVLLLIVLLEWTSKRNHESSLQALESQVSGVRQVEGETSVTLQDTQKKISGFAFRSESGNGATRKLTYRWPSLFKRYHVVLTVDPENHVTLVEAVVGADNSRPADQPITPKFSKPIPRDGRVPVGPNVVSLTTSEFAAGAPRGIGATGSLIREIIRQALLIAARDEMGLSTRDASAGEVLLVSDPASPTFPIELLTTITMNRAVQKMTISLEATRPVANGKWLNWTSGPIQLDSLLTLDEVVVRAEALSRKEFVEVLGQAGFQKRSSTADDATEARANVHEHMDFISQFALLRKLHAQRRVQGESDSTLGALVRAYANLGDLTDYFWTPMFKVFKARSLLYAQRYLATRGATADALAHRAYARALAGQQATALDDVKAAADKGKNASAPSWLKLIEAYCAYQPDVLQHGEKPDRELGLYLNMRISDPLFDETNSQAAIESFFRVNSAPFRGQEMLFEIRSLGVFRSLTEGGTDALWRDAYKRLSELSNLDAGAKQLIQEVVAKPKQFDPAKEHATRIELMNILRQAGSKVTDESEPSYQLLAEMLSEESFIQVVHALDVESRMLGVSTGETMNRLLPLVQGHRMQKFVEGFSDDPQTNSKKISELIAGLSTSAYELPMILLQNYAFRKSDRRLSTTVNQGMQSHSDSIYVDLLQQRRFPDMLKDWLAESLRKVAPHQPIVVAYAIENNWEKDGQVHAAEWEKTYEECPSVMLALGKKYQQLNRYQVALRCFNNSVDTAPSFDGFQAIAELYEKLGDTTASRNALEKALKLPSYGLQDSLVNVRLAKSLMQKGDWKGAAPHAMEAANSFSNWGLTTGARCAEGLNDWKSAESLQKANSERYQGAAAEWYFWCVRTQHGNLKAARSFAEQAWESAKPPLDIYQLESRAVGYVVDGDIDKAASAYEELAKHPDANSFNIMIAAAVQDLQKNASLRDLHWDQVLKSTRKIHHENLYVELLNLFRKTQRPTHPQWDSQLFDDLILHFRDEDVTVLYYFAGVFLQNLGQQDQSKEYLQTAATSFEVQDRSCLFAILQLRQRKLPVGSARLNVWPDAMNPLMELVKSAEQERNQSHFDKAAQHLKDALELRPSCTGVIRERASLNKARGDYSAAIADFEEILRLNPNCDYAHREWAWLLATCPDDMVRNAAEAIQHAQRAIDLRTVPSWLNFSTMAAALAENGDFTAAVEMESKALSLSNINKQLMERISQYRNKQPYRSPLPKFKDKPSL